MTGVWEDRSETQGWCQNYSKSCVTGGSWDWDGEFFQTSAGTATTVLPLRVPRPPITPMTLTHKSIVPCPRSGACGPRGELDIKKSQTSRCSRGSRHSTRLSLYERIHMWVGFDFLNSMLSGSWKIHLSPGPFLSGQEKKKKSLQGTLCLRCTTRSVQAKPETLPPRRCDHSTD